MMSSSLSSPGRAVGRAVLWDHGSTTPSGAVSSGAPAAQCSTVGLGLAASLEEWEKTCSLQSPPGPAPTQ